MRFCLALIFAPAIASAQTMNTGTSSTADGGPPDAGGCGDITFEGECQDNMVVYCESDEIVTIDCPVEYGPTAICQEIDPFYGVDCALAAGETCIYEDGAEFFTDFCQGNATDCVETAENSSCQANVGTC